MLKKVLGLVIAAVGALAIAQKIQAQRAEQELWAEATDTVRD